MISAVFTALLATTASAASIPVNNHARRANSGSTSVTPHDKYSSSIGVLGCKIDTNRVAYWPSEPGCDNICVRVSHGGRDLHLLHIDSSTGAHDISYDAWNYLAYGSSATEDPQQGGGVDMDYEYVDASKCEDLLDKGGKVPLSAPNSMNYVSSCLSEPESYVAKNYELYNIMNAACTWGKDELCELDLDVSNQPSCPSGLGDQSKLDETVEDIEYGTGKKTVAQ